MLIENRLLATQKAAPAQAHVVSSIPTDRFEAGDTPVAEAIGRRTNSAGAGWPLSAMRSHLEEVPALRGKPATDLPVEQRSLAELCQGRALLVPGLDDAVLLEDCLSQLVERGMLTASRDKDGHTLLDNLNRLLAEPTAAAIDARVLTAEAIVHLALPDATIVQGFHSTCSTQPLEYLMATQRPAEYVRLLREVASPAGQVTMASGRQLQRDEKWTKADEGARSTAGCLFQSLMMDGLMAQKASNETIIEMMTQTLGQRWWSHYKHQVGVAVGGMTDGSAVPKECVKDALDSMAAHNAFSSFPASIEWWGDTEGKHKHHQILVTRVGDDDVYFRNSWGINHGSTALPSHRTYGTGEESLAIGDFQQALRYAYFSPQSTPAPTWKQSGAAQPGGAAARFMQVVMTRAGGDAEVARQWGERAARASRQSVVPLSVIVGTGLPVVGKLVGKERAEEIFHQSLGAPLMPVLPGQAKPREGTGRVPQVPVRAWATDYEIPRLPDLTLMPDELPDVDNLALIGGHIASDSTMPCWVSGLPLNYTTHLVALLASLTKNYLTVINGADPSMDAQRVEHSLSRARQKGSWVVTHAPDLMQPAAFESLQRHTENWPPPMKVFFVTNAPGGVSARQRPHEPHVQLAPPDFAKQASPKLSDNEKKLVIDWLIPYQQARSMVSVQEKLAAIYPTVGDDLLTAWAQHMRERQLTGPLPDADLLGSGRLVGQKYAPLEVLDPILEEAFRAPQATQRVTWRSVPPPRHRVTSQVFRDDVDLLQQAVDSSQAVSCRGAQAFDVHVIRALAAQNGRRLAVIDMASTPLPRALSVAEQGRQGSDYTVFRNVDRLSQPEARQLAEACKQTSHHARFFLLGGEAVEGTAALTLRPPDESCAEAVRAYYQPMYGAPLEYMVAFHKDWSQASGDHSFDRLFEWGESMQAAQPYGHASLGRIWAHMLEVYAPHTTGGADGVEAIARRYKALGP